MNRIEIFGNLVAAPEESTTPGGKRLVTTRIASDRGRTDSSGTDYFTLKAWDDAAADALLAEPKGAFLKIRGSIRLSVYGEDNRLGCEVIVRNVEHADTKRAAE